VFVQVLGEDEDVVEVDDYLAGGDKIAEELVHHCLESRRRVCETKEHNKWFVEATVGYKGGFSLVSLLDTDIVVAPAHVQRCEVMGALQLVDHFLDQGERIAVLDCHVVKFPVVLHRPKHAVFFLDKEEGRRHWRNGWAYATCRNVLVDEHVELLILDLRERIELSADRFEVLCQLNSMIPGVFRW
jgi:hypothetical protein